MNNRRRGTLVLCLSLFGVMAYAAVEGLPQWPPAPHAARVKYLYDLTGLTPPSNPGFLGKVMRRLLGMMPGERTGNARRLVNPTGIYVRGSKVYAADSGRKSVMVYDEKEETVHWYPKERDLRLISPVAVAADQDGRIFVLDSALSKVFILDPKGKPLGELRGDPQGMGRPAGLAIAEDRIFVSDVMHHRISVYGKKGIFLHSFGKRGTQLGEFNYPTYLWYEAKTQQLWVSDSANFRVQWLNREGTPLGAFGEGGNKPGFLARPRGLTRDSEGHVYLIDGAFDAFQIFNDAGRLLLFVGQAGTSAGEFSLPGGIFTDSRDRIFVADTFNGRVQVFQYMKEAGG